MPTASVSRPALIVPAMSKVPYPPLMTSMIPFSDLLGLFSSWRPVGIRSAIETSGSNLSPTCWSSVPSWLLIIWVILLLAIENISGCSAVWCSDVQAAACATMYVAIAQAALELYSILSFGVIDMSIAPPLLATFLKKITRAWGTSVSSIVFVQ